MEGLHDDEGWLSGPCQIDAYGHPASPDHHASPEQKYA
jgi:hypothetical protein